MVTRVVTSSTNTKSKWMNMPEPKRKRGTDPTKPRNITLDAETQAALLGYQNKLEKKLGFRPSLPQTVRYVLARAEEVMADE